MYYICYHIILRLCKKSRCHLSLESSLVVSCHLSLSPAVRCLVSHQHAVAPVAHQCGHVAKFANVSQVSSILAFASAGGGVRYRRYQDQYRILIRNSTLRYSPPASPYRVFKGSAKTSPSLRSLVWGSGVTSHKVKVNLDFGHALESQNLPALPKNERKDNKSTGDCVGTRRFRVRQ